LSVDEAYEAYKEYVLEKGKLLDGNNIKEQEIKDHLGLIYYKLNCGRPPRDSKAGPEISYSQFCMAAINETVLINTEKVERAFHLFDSVRYLFCPLICIFRMVLVVCRAPSSLTF
jgi:hypothetical protein